MHEHHLFGPDVGVTLANFLELWVHVFPVDFLRYFITATAVYGMVHIVFAGRLAGLKIRSTTAPKGQMTREFAASTRTAAIFALAGVSVIAGAELNLIHIYGAPGERGWFYFAFTVAALIILHDAWFYWTHRLIHDPRLFRRMHRTHHKSHIPTPFAAYSFDVSDAAINAIFFPLALLLMPVSEWAMMVFLVHMIVRNVIGHSGYELFPSTRDGRPMIPFLTTVTHHDLHHAQAGWNYGLYFTWWDRAMGTEHPLYAEKFAAAVRKPLDGSAVAALRMASV